MWSIRKLVSCLPQVDRFLPRFVRNISNINRANVDLKCGTVSGAVEKLPDGNDFYAFRGIPYGKAPVGESRFQSPQPLDRFASPVLDCSTERNCCVAKNPFNQQWQGSENCLHLNVYTPRMHRRPEAVEKPPRSYIT